MAKYMRNQNLVSQSKQRRRLFLETLEARQMMAADAVLTWNEHLNEVVQLDSVQRGPTKASRAYAMVQIAVYDAVNAITQTHTPYALTTLAPQTASIDAAVAAAARTAMISLYPAQQALINGWYQAELALIPNGQAENDGVAIGEESANLCIVGRDDDGSNAIKLYRPNKSVGHWRPDPTILVSPQMAMDPAWSQVTLFAIDKSTSFPIPPPPALNSAAYAAAFNEVKSLGALNSTTRTQDQTEIGLFWAYDRPNFGPPLVLFNENLAEIVTTTGLENTVEENARLFALANIAMADAGVAIWDYKYKYDFWRPISAIREGAKDGNPLTVGDPTWVPLGAPGNGTTVPDFTPPFPAYGSGHAGFGAALFQVLETFYGTNTVNYTLHSDEGGGLVRNFTSFSQAADENGRSRIYLGVHWQFDNVQSQIQGRQIADFITDRLFQPVSQAETLLSIRKNGGGMQTISLAADVNVLIKRVGANVQILNQSNSSVIFQWPLAQMERITFDARNGEANNLTVDINAGQLTTPFTLDVEGGVGDGDSVTILGSAKAESFRLNGNQLLIGAAVSPTINVPGVEQINLDGKLGNDAFLVTGVQTGRTINLLGDAGNDIYRFGSTGGDIHVNDASGSDFFDFARATAEVELDLALVAGETQANVGGHTLQLTGLIENVDGSSFDDKLFGNALANHLRGYGGNDILRGGGGDDVLEGGGGDDIILGDLGVDKVYGGLGRDLLIGGAGADLVNGQGGEDILIGGNTSHDADEAALLDLMAEWTSAHSNLDRINNLTNGSGVDPENNGVTFLDATTHLNDNALDSLFFTTGDFILTFTPDTQQAG